jgi:uncharacterized protein (DUF1501 family)
LISLSPVVPNFLLQAAAQGAEPANEQSERILVVLQLSGGNDGLNTVVPYGDELYRQNRFTLAVGVNQVLKIDDHVGLHPAMTGFSKLLEAGQLAIVQGVGYPNPNRSHFESMDLWHTAHRTQTNRPAGWLGRYLDAAEKGRGGDVPALHMGAEKQPLALTGEDVQVPSVASIDRFRIELGGNEQLRRAIQQIAVAQREPANELLDFVQ